MLSPSTICTPTNSSRLKNSPLPLSFDAMTSRTTNPNGESFRKSLKKPFDVITYRGTWSMFREIYRLFDQATFCFDAKAYDAVCIMCRATIEAACYVFLTRKREVGLLISPPRTLDGRVRKVPFP